MHRSLSDNFTELTMLPDSVRLNLLDFLRESQQAESQLANFLIKLKESAEKRPTPENH